MERGLTATSGVKRGYLSVSVAEGSEMITVTARRGDQKVEVELEPGDFLNFSEGGARMAKALRTPKEL